MFPILFPRLLPIIYDALVMPAMLQRIAECIPIPEYMLEQMSDLMPKVMDSLMSHMLGDVVPPETRPMIDYLRRK